MGKYDMTVSEIETSDDLKKSLLNLLRPLGGLSSFVEKNDIVLIKPNFNTSDPFPASTDKEFLNAIIDILYEQKVKKIIIGESSTFYRNTHKEMKRLKILDLEDVYKNLEILCFENTKWEEKKIPEGKYLKKIHLPQILNEVDKLIYLPCLKTHRHSKFTGSLKLSLGFTRQSDRLKFHTRRLQEKIADLNKIIHPDLVIMDARKCFINGGPDFGEIAEPNKLLASKNRKDIDIKGIEIIQGFKGNSLKQVVGEELPQIKNFI